jgi:FkbM family methyltransferase
MDGADRPTKVAVGGTSFSVDPSAPHASIWGPMADGSWEPETVRAVRTAVLPGDRVVDIGAWVGPFTLMAASLGADVRAYEPDPVARAELLVNLGHNDFGDRVEVVPAALGATSGQFQLHSGELGDSKSSLVRRAGTSTSTTVEVLDVAQEAVAADFAAASFVKMDVEGAEFDIVPLLVPVLGPVLPDLLLSVHGYPSAERARGWLPSALRRVRTLDRAWGLVARRVLAPLLLLGRQVRLAQALRRYPHRFVAERNGGEWRLVRLIDLVRQLLVPPRSAEFWLSSHDRLAGLRQGRQ